MSSTHCQLCQRKFSTAGALSDHVKNSPAHHTKCTTCDRSFVSQEALNQHLHASNHGASSKSKKAARGIDCSSCRRSFVDKAALNQHVRDAKCYKLQCTTCNRKFVSQEALDQHTRSSPNHGTSSIGEKAGADNECSICRRSFVDKAALNQHVRDAKCYQLRCTTCKRQFASQEAHDQHTRDSHAASSNTNNAIPDFQCSICSRVFVDEAALNQHVRDSKCFKLQCTTCDRLFVSQEALDQHIRDSPGHAASSNSANNAVHDVECSNCDRVFADEAALYQHARDSAGHGAQYTAYKEALNWNSSQPPVYVAFAADTNTISSVQDFECMICNRSFVDKEALDQHCRNSPAHAAFEFDTNTSPSPSPSPVQDLICTTCNRSFVDEKALDQHIRDSPAHGPECTTCNRSFVDQEAFDQHLRYSAVHTGSTPNASSTRTTPLDLFFAHFYNFNYNPRASPADELNRLEKHLNLKRPMWDRVKEDYAASLEEEFGLWFGTDSQDLEAWQSICRAVKIETLPETCSGCRKALKSRHVNLVDLLESVRNGSGALRIFPTERALRKYSLEMNRIFPKRRFQGGELLKRLLREFF